MKIGIITKHLDLPVGLGTYANNLLEALGQVDKQNEYIVYSSHRPARADWPENFRIKNFRIPQRRSKLARWEHFAAPKAAKADGVDLVHYLHTACSIPRLRRPILTGVLDAINWALPGYKLPAAYNLLARRDIVFASHLLTISESAKADIHRLLNVPLEKISVTHLAGPKVEPKAVKKKPYWLFVGGTEKRKNLRTLLEAFSEGDFADMRIKVVGPIAPSPIRDNPDELLQLLTPEQRRRVDFLERVEEKEIASLYREATALVYPSLYEGFGIPILEAMARHTPVIAGQDSSIPEVAKGAAMLVDPRDTHALCQSMERLVADKTRRDKLVRDGLPVARSYSWPETAKQTLKIYEKMAL